MKTKTLITTAVVATLGIAALGIGAATAHGSFGRGHGYGMGPGYGYHMGQGYGQGPGSEYCQRNGAQTLSTPLTIDDVRARMEDHLKWRGNDRLKVGNVTEKDDVITAEIVTVDDSLVRSVEINKTNGQMVNPGMSGGQWGGRSGHHRW